MKSYIMLAAAAAFGFLMGVSFPIEMAPKLLPWSSCHANSLSGSTAVRARPWAPLTNTTTTSNVDGTPLLQPTKNNAASEVVGPKKRKAAERLPPDIVVRESDLHLRRLAGDPREDTPTRKYLLVLTVGYNQKAGINATVHKFSDNFDVVLFHYDGRTTEWDEEFEWSKQAVHVGARGQAKWWYAKRFMHPSTVAPYEYIFLWDEDLGVETFDAEEYLKIVRQHGLEISQPGLDITRGTKTYDINVRINGSEIHRTVRGCADVHQRPCSGFVEVMAPVFTREAWTCVWHMIQNDLVHGWGLDWNFWRCVDVPEEQMGVVDAQYVAHHAVFTLGSNGTRDEVRGRARAEFGLFNSRISDADSAQLKAAAAAASSPL